ncbi:MAG: calcineurin-like phosphoesterase C-terminal domain-containing protein [Tannerellaceae bacterium]|jgi:3',5'-cyclic AMP phosphodiesterase CpdA|nr:calcineurin-like phosphoesterase C-terminal domain-containing protein [Tannerellaceae bacterium]
MKKYLLICLYASACMTAPGQTLVTGYVYEDLNRNGKKDRNEKGIAQVAVSNGTDVILTDEKGKYQCPVADDHIIFVIKPAGYQATLDEYNLPETYYIHKPKGSPALHYEGVKPTGDLPGSVDFALHRYEEPESFAAFVFGDTQTYTEEEIAFLRNGIVAEAGKSTSGVRFGITLGDLVGDALNLHQPYKETIRQIGLPWYNVMGNHDMNYDVKEDSLADENFELHFGPASYAFNYGRAHFIVLDDILYPHPLTGQGYWGGLREDQWRFIENDLRHVPSDRLIVISMHIPLEDVEEKGAFRDSDRQRFYSLLDAYPQVLFLSAHTHIQVQNSFGKEQGLNRDTPIHEYNAGTVCGDWYSGLLDENGIPVSTMRDGTPTGYALLRIDGNRYVIDYKVYGKPQSYQIGVYHPQVVPAGKSTSAAIYANFFMGSKQDTVEYRIDNEVWTKMNRVDEPDPAYSRSVQDWDFVEHLPPGRRPSNPVVCTHLWRGNIPTRLPAGMHRIEIRAKDRFGRLFTAESTCRVE